jgi:hypothetical protein
MRTRGSVLGASKPEEDSITDLHDAAFMREDMENPTHGENILTRKGNRGELVHAWYRSTQKGSGRRDNIETH